MDIKKHVLFIISDEPLGLGKEILEKISNRTTTHHFIYEELELKPHEEGMRTEKELPLHTYDERMSLVPTGIGLTVSLVIINFLRNLVCSVFEYKPHYAKTCGEKQRAVEDMIITDSRD